MASPVGPACPNRELPSTHIRIPPFWPEKPEIWFAQVEGQFAIMRVTDETAKFYHILASLDRQYAAEVEDVLTGPPDYQRLKEELIKRLSASRGNKVKQLLTHEQLCTRKLSQFLRHLQHLTGPEIPEDFLRTIWTSRLPTTLQPIVASQSTLPLDALAELADRVHEIAAPVHDVAAAVTSSSSSSSQIDRLSQQVAELTRKVSALATQVHHQPRPQERGLERERQRQRSHSSSRRSQSHYRRYPICWYHSKHGAEARKCVRPCDYKAGNPTSRQVMATRDCHNSTGRLFIKDRSNNIDFLIDTGSDICVYPISKLCERRAKTSYQLSAANSTVIDTYGYTQLNVNLGLRRNFPWRFVVATSQKPL
ncbi:uncharacterized protein LOC134201704 [Bombyx mori]|uniref:uncharacterized protein LOC134201704 n=1 Tax=Bombyx mori TaxID=7091 RepID=UPI002ED129BF